MRWTVAFPMFPADHLLPMARAAEAAGFDTIAVPDSVFFPEKVSAEYPYSADGGRFWAPETPFLDPFVSIAAMVAVTERIRFLTNVVKLPIRDPLLVAKQLSSMAVLSNDRVGLGVGLSWIPEEFAWTHTEMKHARQAGRRDDRDPAARLRRWRPAVGRVPRQALRLRPPDDLARAGAAGADLRRWPVRAGSAPCGATR